MSAYRRGAALIAALLYVLTIVAANWLTERYGLVAIGFGLTATAGTFAAGFVLLWRNVTQDAVGRVPVLALMVVGAALSWWLASPALSVASLVAFGLSETADMAVYTPLRKHGWGRASMAATVVGAVVDTIVFLWIAGFPIWSSLPGQLVVKVGVCAAVILIVKVAGAVLREPVNTEGA